MKYLAKNIKGFYATWLPGLNRYVLFKEPAFRVFSQWSDNRKENEIIDEIVNQYNISPNDAKRFFDEITEHLKVLVEQSSRSDLSLIQDNTKVNSLQNLFSKNYNLNGITIQISYDNSYIEESIHPRLSHLFVDRAESNSDKIFTLTFSQGLYFLESGDGEKRPFKLVEELAGGLYLQLLNIIHGIPPASWMGVAHASAVTSGKEAILFMAPSGGGKSTIASLLLANGYKLLSDDFVPIALNEPEVYSFPAGISVKETAIPFIKEYFPEIENLNITERPGLNKNGVFLPFPSESLSTKNLKTKAIVFVQYDKSVDCRFKRSPNHELMEQFLVESWIANNPAAAGRFMDWYFNLEVYTLQYSDSKKAVTRIKKIFKD